MSGETHISRDTCAGKHGKTHIPATPGPKVVQLDKFWSTKFGPAGPILAAKIGPD